MDQAKFGVPRNLNQSSEFENLWRPTLHVTGCIVCGHMECYYIMNSDQPKDPNMECTVVSRTLDVLQKSAFQGTQYQMPRTLEVQIDNTAREGVNTTFATYMSWLQAIEAFEATQTSRFQVDHTHNEMDQRFSSLATILASAPSLEDPSDFKDWILKHLKPVLGRTLHVEVLDVTFDFKLFFSGLGMQFHGLTTSASEPHANHCWKFCQRDAVDRAFGAESIEVAVDGEQEAHKEQRAPSKKIKVPLNICM